MRCSGGSDDEHPAVRYPCFSYSFMIILEALSELKLLMLLERLELEQLLELK